MTAATRRAGGGLLSALALALLVAGCGASRASRPGPANLLPFGRALVLGRMLDGDNGPVAAAAAGLLARALRRAGDVMVAGDFLAEVPQTDDVWVRRLLDDLRRGRWPDVDASARLERLGLSTLVVVSVSTYEQVWGKYAKFTRVGLEAQAFHLAEGRTVWRVLGFSEIEDKRGRAFQIATEDAARQVAGAVYPEPSGLSLAGMWRAWRR